MSTRMVAAVFLACMAIIAQINAAPTPDSGSAVPHKNNEFDLPPKAREGFYMTLNVSVNADSIVSKALEVTLLPDAADGNKIIPEYCKDYNHEGKHICVMRNPEWENRSGGSEQITYHIIGIKAQLYGDGKSLELSVTLNENHHGWYFMPLDDFEKQKHFSVGGIIEIQKLEFEFTNLPE